MTDDDKRLLASGKWGFSCGQPRANRMDADFVDPGTLPDLPALISVDFEDRTEDDVASYDSYGIPVVRTEKMIGIPGLNPAQLRRARENHRNALNDSWTSRMDVSVLMGAAAKGVLLPDRDNPMPPVFTTSRSCFGVYTKRLLLTPPQQWN